MILFVIAQVLLCSLCCFAQPNVPPTVKPIPDDKINWKEIWKVMNKTGMSRTDEPNLSVFDTIFRVNARERGQGTSRTDTDIFLFEADIQLNKNDVKILLSAGSQGSSRKKRAVIRKTSTNLWRRNIAYAIASSLNSRGASVVRSAIREWQSTLSCMGPWRDVTRTSKPRDYMHFFRGGGCYSQVGRVGGGQRISIGRGCEHHGIAVHEIGHAMGLWHEQSRPDRDRYVRILWNNIIPAMRFNFQKQKTSRVNSLGVPYDYGSVMHYGSTAFARSYGLKTIAGVGGQTLGQRRGLSSSDKKQVRILYGCTTTTKPAGCTDTPSHKSWCTESRKLGLCRNTLFKSYMTSHCCLKCRPVPTTPNPACSDTKSRRNCNGWKQSGFCKPGHRYEKYMRKHCCKTCTSASKTCVDKKAECSTWKVKGYCTKGNFIQFMKEKCAKTCGC